MEEGSVLSEVAGNGMASDSHSLVVEIKMDKMPEHCGGGASKKLMEASGSDTTRIKGKGSCSSWVVEIEKMLDNANASVEVARWSRHSIYRVPQFMKDMTNSQAYSPLYVSLGPYHHGEPHLLPMEEHKRRAVAHMVNRSGKRLQEFVAAIDEVSDDLQAAYSDLDEKWRGANKGRFVEMMVMDGCFLLELARTRTSQIDEDVLVDYATNDPVFSKESYEKLWTTRKRDMIAMENQLPLIVLQRLLAVGTGKFPKAREVNRTVQLLLGVYSDEGIDELGLHILDIFHKRYCAVPPQSVESGPDEYEGHTPCAFEQAESGIRFERSEMRSIHNVVFENGVLRMPVFLVSDTTETELLNLMAFEWLHPDAKFDVVKYVFFMDQIIVSERDAALLKSEGMIENLVGSDKKVVEMFYTLTKLTWIPEDGDYLAYVNWMINSHCKRRRNKWRAIFMKTYLSDPWVITSMVAAFLLLVATLMQTVYTVVPFYTRNDGFPCRCAPYR